MNRRPGDPLTTSPAVTVTSDALDRHGQAASRAISHSVLATFAGALLLVLGIALVALSNVQSVYRTNALVAQSYSVRSGVDALLTALVDAETGQRGFVITGEPRYLEPYNNARQIIDQRIRTLLQLTADNPDQHADVQLLSRAADRKLAELAETIRLRRDDGFQSAQQIIAMDGGKKLMDDMRAIVARMSAREAYRLNERTEAAERSYRTAVAAGTVSAILAIASMALLFFTIRRNAARRQELLLATINEREYLRVTLMGIGDGVIVTDRVGHVSLMNPVAEALTGRSMAEAAGRPVEESFVIVNEQTRAPVENPVQRVISEGTLQGLANHTLLISADGGERAIDDSGAPIRGPGGELLGAVLVFRDVTPQRAAAAALALALRATEESRARLEAQGGALRDAARAKDEFLAVVSHELRTPINAVLGWTRMLQEDSVREERRKGVLETIGRNAQSLAKMIEDLVDMSRLASGKMRMSVGEVDLKALTQDAIDAVRFSATNKGVKLEVSLPDEPPVVAGDADRLKQVIWNLVMNGIKFTPAGGGVTVTLNAGEAAVHLAVRDTGIGIAPDFLPHVFERFRQAEVSAARSGLGLGLAIARHLVEMHGGTIEAESGGANQGARFVVTIPTANAAGPSPEAAAN